MAMSTADDIPLSAVITSEPKSDFPPVLPVDTEGESGGGSGGGPTLTGLGPLMATNKLVLKQKIRACDILSACTGCEVEKKYTIHGSQGEIIYWAKETSGFCMRLCCGVARELDISITDPTGSEIFHLSRPLNCIGCCCNFMYPKCTQELTVSRNGRTIGIIRERATWLYPVYHLFSPTGEYMMKIRGPCWHFGCCDDVEFQVTNSDGVHQATISKKWIGCCHESFLDADNFAVEFVDILSADQRAMILSASFLIDLMYYEEQGGAAA